MAGSFGGTIKLTGETQYRRALNQITNNLKVLDSELKMVSSGYDRNDKSVKNLSQQNTVLNKKISEQKEKVKELEKALDEAQKETGENSTTTQYWKKQLYDAKAELNRVGLQLDKNTKDMNEFESSMKNAGNGALQMGDIVKGNLISGAIQKGVGLLAAGIKKVANSVLEMGKQAIASFAEYEQLVGGVETLFGESSGIIQEYAANAYKTAGLSSNEYMKQVTNFSASLLNALGGDTVSAAKYADMAVTDMADNANKMGTSMEMLENAYQGFSKQNYTMLDNLKLGYGGTKKEMERLLADAEKLSGKKFDISNLNDVFEAIHIIQQEIGITGTTAAEAEGTIAGSTLAMKASWQNLLTGMADDNANFDVLIQNFVQSATTAFQNMMPRITQVISGAVKLVSELTNALLQNSPLILDAVTQIIDELIAGLPTLLDTLIGFVGEVIIAIGEQTPIIVEKVIEILPAIVEGLLSGTQTLFDAAVQLLNSIILALPDLVTKLVENLPMIINTISNFFTTSMPMIVTAATTLFDGIIQALPQIITALVGALPSIIDSIVNFFVSNCSLIMETGMTLFNAIIDAIPQILPVLIEALPTIIDKIGGALVEAMPEILKMAVDLFLQIVEGMVEMMPKLLSKLPEIGQAVKTELEKLPDKIREIGGNLIEGLWNGIKSMGTWLKDKLSSFADSVVEDIKGFFGIHSPSRVFKNVIGKNLALGLGEGFTEQMKNVSREMQNSVPTEFGTDIVSNSRKISNPNSNLSGSNNLVFNQYINSPKSLSRLEIYRDTKRALAQAI